VYITPTEEGRRFLRQLDRTTTREFFARVRIKARSQQAQEFAAAVWELNRELPRVIEGPLPLRYTTDYRDDI
jgi:hypothetical protein